MRNTTELFPAKYKEKERNAKQMMKMDRGAKARKDALLQQTLNEILRVQLSKTQIFETSNKIRQPTPSDEKAKKTHQIMPGGTQKISPRQIRDHYEKLQTIQEYQKMKQQNDIITSQQNGIYPLTPHGNRTSLPRYAQEMTEDPKSPATSSLSHHEPAVQEQQQPPKPSDTQQQQPKFPDIHENKQRTYVRQPIKSRLKTLSPQNAKKRKFHIPFLKIVKLNTNKATETQEQDDVESVKITVCKKDQFIQSQAYNDDELPQVIEDQNGDQNNMLTTLRDVEQNTPGSILSPKEAKSVLLKKADKAQTAEPDSATKTEMNQMKPDEMVDAQTSPSSKKDPLNNTKTSGGTWINNKKSQYTERKNSNHIKKNLLVNSGTHGMGINEIIDNAFEPASPTPIAFNSVSNNRTRKNSPKGNNIVLFSNVHGDQASKFQTSSQQTQFDYDDVIAPPTQMEKSGQHIPITTAGSKIKSKQKISPKIINMPMDDIPDHQQFTKTVKIKKSKQSIIASNENTESSVDSKYQQKNQFKPATKKVFPNNKKVLQQHRISQKSVQIQAEFTQSFSTHKSKMGDSAEKLAVECAHIYRAAPAPRRSPRRSHIYEDGVRQANQNEQAKQNETDTPQTIVMVPSANMKPNEIIMLREDLNLKHIKGSTDDKNTSTSDDFTKDGKQIIAPSFFDQQISQVTEQDEIQDQLIEEVKDIVAHRHKNKKDDQVRIGSKQAHIALQKHANRNISPGFSPFSKQSVNENQITDYNNTELVQQQQPNSNPANLKLNLVPRQPKQPNTRLLNKDLTNTSITFVSGNIDHIISNDSMSIFRSGQSNSQSPKNKLKIQIVQPHVLDEQKSSLFIDKKHTVNLNTASHKSLNCKKDSKGSMLMDGMPLQPAKDDNLLSYTPLHPTLPANVQVMTQNQLLKVSKPGFKGQKHQKVNLQHRLQLQHMMQIQENTPTSETNPSGKASRLPKQTFDPLMQQQLSADGFTPLMEEQEAYDKMVTSKKFLSSKVSNLRYYQKNEKIDKIDSQLSYIEKLKQWKKYDDNFEQSILNKNKLRQKFGEPFVQASINNPKSQLKYYKDQQKLNRKSPSIDGSGRVSQRSNGSTCRSNMSNPPKMRRSYLSQMQQSHQYEVNQQQSLNSKSDQSDGDIKVAQDIVKSGSEEVTCQEQHHSGVKNPFVEQQPRGDLPTVESASHDLFDSENKNTSLQKSQSKTQVESFFKQGRPLLQVTDEQKNSQEDMGQVDSQENIEQWQATNKESIESNPKIILIKQNSSKDKEQLQIKFQETLNGTPQSLVGSPMSPRTSEQTKKTLNSRDNSLANKVCQLQDIFAETVKKNSKNRLETQNSVNSVKSSQGKRTKQFSSEYVNFNPVTKINVQKSDRNSSKITADHQSIIEGTIYKTLQITNAEFIEPPEDAAAKNNALIIQSLKVNEFESKFKNKFRAPMSGVRRSKRKEKSASKKSKLNDVDYFAKNLSTQNFIFQNKATRPSKLSISYSPMNKYQPSKIQTQQNFNSINQRNFPNGTSNSLLFQTLRTTTNRAGTVLTNPLQIKGDKVKLEDIKKLCPKDVSRTSLTIQLDKGVDINSQANPASVISISQITNAVNQFSGEKVYDHIIQGQSDLSPSQQNASFKKMSLKDKKKARNLEQTIYNVEQQFNLSFKKKKQLTKKETLKLINSTVVSQNLRGNDFDDKVEVFVRSNDFAPQARHKQIHKKSLQMSNIDLKYMQPHINVDLKELKTPERGVSSPSDTIKGPLKSLTAKKTFSQVVTSQD